MTIGKKIGLGFAVILFLLTGLSLWSIFGIKKIVVNASEVIDGNKLRAIMVEKEVDHLNWANKVSSLITDDHITKLEVELDDHQCAFGKWLYDEDKRKKAIKLVPQLESLLKDIEEPHRKLHESAKHIKAEFKQTDGTLPGVIAAKISDHLNWANLIRDCFLENKDKLIINTDATTCALGKWLKTDQAQPKLAAKL